MEDNYIFRLQNQKMLQFWNEGSTQHYLTSPTKLMPRELVKFGTKDGPIVAPNPLPSKVLERRGVLAAGIATYSRGYFHFRQKCAHHVLLFGLKGALHTDFENEKHDLRSGCIMCIPAGCTCDESVKIKNSEVLWFNVGATPEWNAALGSKVFLRRSENFTDITRLAELFDKEAYSHAPSISMLEKIADLLMALIFREFSPASDSRRNTLEGLFRKIQERPEAAWDTTVAAKSMGVSKGVLEYSCRNKFGENFSKILLRIRMKAAFAILVSQNIQLSEVAAAVGYATPFSFSKAFKNFYGKSPKKFVKTSEYSPEFR